jgi:hypothetical protein
MNTLMSVLAVYNFDNTLFDNLVLPAGVDKDDVVNNILVELCEFEVLYPDPDVLKSVIGFWSKKELSVWTKLNTTTTLDYNPLNNLYRDETETHTETRDLGGTTSHNSTTTGSTQNSGTDSQKEYISAFNETTATLSKQTDQTLGTGNSVNGSVNSSENTTDTGTVTTSRTAHYQGSIGVITAQNMIKQEREINTFNIVDYIINDFKNRFCLLVY